MPTSPAPDAAPALAAFTHRLTERVRRQPPSLANYHFHLEIGTEVLVLSVDEKRGTARVTRERNPAHRIAAEDLFVVSLTDIAPLSPPSSEAA